ncbi:MAG: undecaprenyl-diphosphatase UppP [Bacteroidota bacterium]
MNILHAIILGIIQGLSEFIPISSTAHLTIAGKLFGLISAEHPEEWTAFIAVLQLGTIAAVLVFFRKRIISICFSFFKDVFIERKSYSSVAHDTKLGWFVIIGTLPVVTIGIALKKIIEGSITKNLWMIAINLFVFAIILAVAEKFSTHTRPMEKISLRDAIAIGCAQVFALFPGASRSGVTMSAGLFSGLTRETAAEFSFLLSIPAIVGSGILELRESLQQQHSFGGVETFIGTLTAGIVGYASIWFLLHYLKTHTNALFIAYRIALGIIICGLLLFSIIPA